MCQSVLQHECEPPAKREAVWNAASRLETVETAATIANHKNAHKTMDMDTEACNASKLGPSALQRSDKKVLTDGIQIAPTTIGRRRV